MDEHVFPQEIFVGVDALAVFFCRIGLERMFRLFLQGWAGTEIFGFGWWLIPRVRRAERLRTGTGTGYNGDLFCIVRVHRCMVDLYGSKLISVSFGTEFPLQKRITKNLGLLGFTLAACMKNGGVEFRFQGCGLRFTIRIVWDFQPYRKNGKNEKTWLSLKSGGLKKT